MKICKCDRCGKIFEPKPRGDLILERYSDRRNLYEDIDLCDFCYTSIKVWFKNENPEDATDRLLKTQKILINDAVLDLADKIEIEINTTLGKDASEALRIKETMEDIVSDILKEYNED